MKQVDANTTSPTETAVQNPFQFSDCDFPTTKEEVKGEEVQLGGGITKWIPFTDMKELRECPYCSKRFLNQSYLTQHIAKQHTAVQNPLQFSDCDPPSTKEEVKMSKRRE